MAKSVAVYGNSVAIRIRPRKSDAKVFSEILNMDDNLVVTNNALAASMISDYNFIKVSADYGILMFGIVEASTRSLPRKLYQYLYLNDNPFLLAKPFVFGLRYLETKLRKRLVKLRSFKSWLSHDAFINTLKTTINILRENHIEVIVIGINKPSQRIEGQLPKTISTVQLFNTKTKELCKELNISYISTYETFSESLMPDGIHFNAEGHKKLAEEIRNIIMP